MIQFYLLSVLCNAAAGYTLISGKEPQNSFQLILGVLTAITGIFKLLSAVQGDVPVIGDIVPAGVGLIAGTALLLGYYRNVSSLEPAPEPSLLELFLDGYKKPIGFSAIAAAILHFLFPQALFF
ncbi:MAG: hypothetical protein LBG87_01920 [Spirochaetaceae bacterium]|jgi:hypothetical protein|nr:hypothetical protein [Spirochaetaceae bacterium]